MQLLGVLEVLLHTHASIVVVLPQVLEFQISLQNGLGLLERQPCFHHFL